jgi:cystathionine beta-lyase/cystathionine gamma-synthase
VSRFDTLAVHAGRRPDGDSGAILTPIHQVATYAQEELGVHKGHTYSRASNPTVSALEARLAALEGGCDAICFASGMAAIDAVLRRLRSGDHVVLTDVVYGGTVRLLREVYARVGIEFTLADGASTDTIEAALRGETRLVLVESPANPTLKLVDIAAIAQRCRSRSIPLVVDNTFLTPHGQRAIELGADLVIHSTTKQIEGHNATIGGAVIVRDDPSWVDWLRLARKTAGTNLAPFDAWLTLRGSKTLGVRCERSAATALLLATWLEAQPGIARVHYPGLASHPQHDLARRQQRHGGAVIAVELAGGIEAVRRFVASLGVITLAESLGAVESLVTHPATMTHGAYTPEERAAAGVGDGLLRLSIGLEDPHDLREDLTRALAAAHPAGVEIVG